MISGYLADIFGRVPVCLSAIAICSILSFSGSFAQDYWTWFFLRLFTGFASKGLFQVAFIISMEICGKDWRMLLGILINVRTQKKTRSVPNCPDLAQRFLMPLVRWLLVLLLTFYPTGETCK